MGVWGLCRQWGPCTKPLVVMGSGAKPSGSWRYSFVKICYFEPALRRMHDYMNQFNIKWEKNQFRGRKVVGQAAMLPHWVQKMGGQLPALPNRLRASAAIVGEFDVLVAA